MKRLHPIRICFANVALMLLLGANGCKSTSSGVGNPFLAPDRVPPPGTHALLPGQAQPYYQGDPLPSSAQAPPSVPAASVAANTTQTTLSPAGRTLAWNAPATAAASAPTAPVAGPPVAQPVAPPPQTAVAANEASIAVPTDADPLRYPLPQSPRVETPPSPAPAATAATRNTATPAQPENGTRPTSLQNVLLASYNVPAATATPPVQTMTPAVPQQTVSPWRSPQLVQPLNSPANVSQPSSIQPLVGSLPAQPSPAMSPIVQQPVAIPTNTMAATLRAVTPPPQLGDPMPRIRMPDYLPPPPITTADGFRPRTSMQ